MFWSPADWAWAGGLIDALLPSWYFGMPILGYRGRFDAGDARITCWKNTACGTRFCFRRL